MNSTPTDTSARHRALDPTHSFIVQAPAGSGKTELLTQRYLRLLGCVQQPEEIVSLTFTRKAAAEMRGRIGAALHAAASGAAAETGIEQTRLALATEALRRDRECGWHLTENPQRLRVMTIDAFNGSLVRQMPLLSRMGGALTTTDRAGMHYREAARCTLAHLCEPGGYREALMTLLAHFDNRTDRIEQQLVNMLEKREQWLALVSSALAVDKENLQAQLERVLNGYIEARLQALCEATPPSLRTALPPLARGGSRATACRRARVTDPATESDPRHARCHSRVIVPMARDRSTIID